MKTALREIGGKREDEGLQVKGEPLMKGKLQVKGSLKAIVEHLVEGPKGLRQAQGALRATVKRLPKSLLDPRKANGDPRRVRRSPRRVKRNPRPEMIRRVSMACLTLLLFTLASCSKGEMYYRYHHVQHGKWHRDSSLLFAIDPVALQPGRPYGLSIELSFNNAYPYQDLWLLVEHNLTTSPFHADTLHVKVADERGRWLGTGVGGLHQLSIAYPHVVRPTTRDSTTGYRVTVAHYMDDNPLKGVEKVGLKLVQQ